MTVTDWVSIIACMISAAAFGLAYWSWAQTQNSMSLYLSTDVMGPYLDLTNNSPHAVTIVDFGIIKPDGRRSSFQDEFGMRLRMDPRDTYPLRIPVDAASRIRKLTSGSTRWCCYVQLATSQRFYAAGRLRRLWWWISGWVNGNRRIPSRHSLG